MGDISERCQQLAELLVEPLRHKARELGYALLLHGSVARDIDLVAVPWTNTAVPARQLAEAVRDLSASLNDGLALESDRIGAANPEFFDNGCPGMKPHGRLCWTYHLGGGPYIDLSVMPILEGDHGWPHDRRAGARGAGVARRPPLRHGGCAVAGRQEIDDGGRRAEKARDRRSRTMKRYSVDTSHGDCAVGFMAEDPDGDYVEFELLMAMVTAEELAELRLNAARYKQVREYYWFQREVAHRFCVTEPNSVNDLDAALDRARGVK